MAPFFYRIACAKHLTAGVPAPPDSLVRQQRAAPPPKRRRGSRRCFVRPCRLGGAPPLWAPSRAPRRGCPVLGPLSGTARGTLAVCARIQSAAPYGPAVVRVPVATGRAAPRRQCGGETVSSALVPTAPPRRRPPPAAPPQGRRAAPLRGLPSLLPAGGGAVRLGGPPLRARPTAAPRSPRRVPAHKAAAPRRGDFSAPPPAVPSCVVPAMLMLDAIRSAVLI